MRSLDADAFGDHVKICGPVVPDEVDLISATGQRRVAEVGHLASDDKSSFEASCSWLWLAPEDVEMESALLHVLQEVFALGSTPIACPSWGIAPKAPPSDSRVVCGNSRHRVLNRRLDTTRLRTRHCHGRSHRRYPHGPHVRILPRQVGGEISHPGTNISVYPVKQRGTCVQPPATGRSVR